MDHQISSSSNAYVLPKNAERTCGRWTSEEHRLFIIGLNNFGKNWKKIEQLVQTRTGSQIRSHAQKYFNKLGKHSDKNNSHDWDIQTSVPNCHDGVQTSSNSFINFIMAYSEQNQNFSISYPSKKHSYLHENMVQNPFKSFSSSQNSAQELIKDKTNSSFSYFFQHIFPIPDEALRSDFYEMFVQHSSQRSSEFQNGGKQQPKESKRKVSFTLFSPQDSEQEGCKKMQVPVIQIIESSV